MRLFLQKLYGQSVQLEEYEFHYFLPEIVFCDPYVNITGFPIISQNKNSLYFSIFKF